MSPLAVRTPALVCAALLTVACGDASREAGNEIVLDPIGARGDDIDYDREGGEADAGLAEGDDGEPDAGSDVRSNERDALPPGCTLADEDRAVVAETFVSPDDELALSVRNEGALLTWVGFQAGERQLTPMWIAANAPEAANVIVGGEAAQRDPTSTLTDEGFVAVWSEGEDGHGELYAHRVSAAGVQADESQRLTTDARDDRRPIAATGADGRVLVVWQAAERVVDGKALLLDVDGTPIGAPRDVTGMHRTLGRPALSALGDGYMLSWIDERSRRVATQLFDANGLPVSPARPVDSEMNAEAHIDLAASEDGAAVAFDVRVAGERPEVRVRAFDADGATLGIEQSLTNAEETGLSPSIAAFRGGYAVAYRSDRGGERSLRIAFLNARGEKIAATSVSDLGALDLPTTLRISPDGRSMFVAWTDSVESSGAYALHRAWIRCE